MSECKDCINAVPGLSAGGLRPAEWQWPENFECIMNMPEFPGADNCDWLIEIKAGEAT